VPRVLVVDDEPSICSLLTDALQDGLSADVTCALSGAAGATLIAVVQFDLALIDVRLGDGSGVGLAKLAANENVPVLLMSGHPSIAVDLQRLALPFLAKPFTMDRLFAEARRVILETADNINRVKASAARLQTNIESLTDVVETSRRLIKDGKFGSQDAWN
jgi:DNA-binding NtrC family response regulator